VAKKDPKTAARAVAYVVKQLENAQELAGLTARALLDAAQQAAQRRPTPQAPMAAAGFSVDNEAIRGPTGQLAEVVMGSEFGSLAFRQFGSRHSGGSWLFPTIETPPATVTREQEDWIDEVLSNG